MGEPEHDEHLLVTAAEALSAAQAASTEALRIIMLDIKRRMHLGFTHCLFEKEQLPDLVAQLLRELDYNVSRGSKEWRVEWAAKPVPEPKPKTFWDSLRG